MQGLVTYTDLKGKHVLITGGGAGIGATLCLEFAKQGSVVTFLDKNPDGARLVLETCREFTQDITFFEVDLTNTDNLVDVLASVKRNLPAVDVLIPNAGYDPRYDRLDMSKAQWEELFSLNVTHYFITCRELIPSMVEAGGGSIVMTSSHVVWLAKPDLVAYNTTKAAVVGFIKSLAEAYGKDNIRVNGVAPGWVMTERQLTQWVTPETKRHTIDNLQAMPIKLTPEILAGNYLFLASDSSKALTRQILVADAGQSKH
jgi:NAD(P)-dependent dehydrogenase (short-subunit alcohol dehydrogenase family)